MCMKGVDLPDQYLSYNPNYMKNYQMDKKGFYVYAKLCFIQFICGIQETESAKKVRFSFFLQVVKDWIENQYVFFRKSREDASIRLSGNMKYHKYVNIPKKISFLRVVAESS